MEWVRNIKRNEVGYVQERIAKAMIPLRKIRCIVDSVKGIVECGVLG
jgi:hypothetical protein